MVVFFSLLLVGVQGVALLMVNSSSVKLAEQRTAEQLESGARIFQRQLSENLEKLTGAAEILAADYGFRQAIASLDRPTIRSVLENHSYRIGADMSVLVSMDRVVLAHSLNKGFSVPSATLSTLIEQVETTGSASGVLTYERQIYQVVVVPVLAPDPIAWLTMGFRIDDELATDLKSLTGLDVSFFAYADEGWKPIASSQPANVLEPLQQWVSATFHSSEATPQSARLGDQATRVTLLTDDAGRIGIAVLQRSLRDLYESLDKLQFILFSLAAASIAVSVIGSIIIAHGIARPLLMLAEVSKKVQEGDYNEAARIAKEDEIGLMANSFNQMRESISVLLQLAYRDSLTQLPNRSMFNDRLDQALKLSTRTGAPFTLMMMDLNKFKQINDTLGHDAGDEVIRTVGRRLPLVLRDCDTVARLGGDEFAILLTTGDHADIKTVADKIRNSILEPIPLRQQSVEIGCSLGAAAYPTHGREVETLMHRADMAMYVAKRTKSNSVVIYEECHEADHQEPLSMAAELRRAIKNGEFRMHFQPTVDVAGSNISAVEALTYWQHPQRGLIPPAQFLAAAQEEGIMQEITAWVIETAVQHCAVWLAQGSELVVSLNLSKQDLLTPDLAETIERSLKSTGVPPRMLCFEVPECIVLDDIPELQLTLKKLAAIGVNLAIDKFAGVYASLSKVSDLPLTEIKIDMALIADLAVSPQAELMIEMAIEFANKLGFNIVATGVESEQELQILRRLGCERIQGYLMSRPLPAERLQDWINRSPWTVQPRVKPSLLSSEPQLMPLASSMQR